jgi:two-component sensor histidine kinase
LATPLAVVLTEALQNVVDHAYRGEVLASDGSGPGQVVVELANDGVELRVKVIDDGRGLPPGFSVDTATGLGLSIVRTLVTTELAGSIELYAGDGSPERPGTVVDIRVPLSDLRFPLTGEVPVVG